MLSIVYGKTLGELLQRQAILTLIPSSCLLPMEPGMSFAHPSLGGLLPIDERATKGVRFGESSQVFCSNPKVRIHHLRRLVYVGLGDGLESDEFVQSQF